MSQTNPLREEDDEDDWFSKDEADFVVEMTKTSSDPCVAFAEETKIDGASPESSVQEMLDRLKNIYQDSDGNYINNIQRGDLKVITKSDIGSAGSKQYIQTIPVTRLANIMENETIPMFIDLCAQKNEFCATLMKKTYSNELMLLLLRIMDKLGKIPLQEMVKQFFVLFVCQDHFFEQLLIFFRRSTVNEEITKKKKVKIIRPTVAYADMLNALLIFLIHTKNYNLFNDAMLRFCDALSLIRIEKDERQSKLLNELKAFKLVEQSSKRISIYPTANELKDIAGPSLNLKPNIVHGKYTSVQHYLDVHLNLLKEDFLTPIRSDLQKYRNFVAKHPNQWTYVGDNIRIHYPVKLFLPETINRHAVKVGQLITLDLDPIERGNSNESVRYRRLALPTTKRFLIGSMVLFSNSSEIDNLIVGVISGRDPNQLLNGFVFVELIQIEQLGTAQDSDGMEFLNRPLLMVESEIFFEPYHQTFKALARLREDNFPFKSHIVDVVKTTNRLPRYLAERKDNIFTYSNVEFNLKQPENWPKELLKDAIGMNDSQLSAYQMALTNQFSLIQGPPGTGKTFIGLKIVETLLANTSKQILLICLTNHALDEFLCGVARFTQSIVRMGGQSKHPLLDMYNIKQLHEDEQTDRRLRACYYIEKQEYLKLIEELNELQSQQEDKQNSINKAIIECMDKLLTVSRRLNELNQLYTQQLIKNKRVVAMTTTYPARNHALLEILRIPVVVFEEAAEVLEAHIVSSLTQYTDHCVLIGDHMQLRPMTSTYVLSSQYQMDLSLFERMIKNSFNVATMTVQHRMRPEIANILRSTIYPMLEDADSVYLYPNVVGMKHNLFFLHHTVPEVDIFCSQLSSKDFSKYKEDVPGNEKTRRNTFECKFLLCLCEYLLAQGVYTAEDIIILTAYNGQKNLFASEIKARPALQRVQIAVIDNYQGEECKIVLLSLVRSGNLDSSSGDTIGFLSQKNRICVALSRAREGFYIVGNMDQLSRCSKVWTIVNQQLCKQEAIGVSLPLQCSQHGQVVEVQTPEEFEKLNSRSCICGAHL